jgi:glucose/arabinose dehydrogenase
MPRINPVPAVVALVCALPITHAQTLEVYATGLTKPVDMVADPTSPARFLVVEQDGLVRVVENGVLLDEPFIAVDRGDFTDRKSNWERGLLGIALDPGYAENRRFYLYYTDKEGATVTSRFTAASPTSADWGTEEVLLRIDQPFGNHNGGCIRFGPDGMLYIGPGDGGSANDPQGYAQKLDTLLGKLLRIDVTGEPDEGLAYAIPDDNPFVGTEGARPEIWAYGLRNPWRFEFDSKGRLWIADVGQNRFEYVHLQPEGSKGGENYGWNTMEGFGEFKPGRNQAEDPKRLPPSRHLERGLMPPVFEYRHHPVGSITGGFFYEGDKLPWLKGRYICADYMSGRTWSFIVRQRGEAWTADDIVEHTASVSQSFGGNGASLAISSFGRDLSGNALFILDHNAGRILRFAD